MTASTWIVLPASVYVVRACPTCVQAAAILPGVSRSGSTIAVALFLGVQRGRAFELSMLMGVPVVLGATILELPQMMHSLVDLPSALVGALVACFSGVFAMLTLRKVVVAGIFPLFSLWVLPLAVATLALSRAWPH